MKKQNFILPITLFSVSALSACTLPGMENQKVSTASGVSISSEVQVPVILSGAVDTGVITRTETLSYDSKTPE